MFVFKILCILPTAADKLIKWSVDCVCVHTLKGKRLKLSTPNLVDIQVHGSRLACIDPAWGQRSMSHSYQVHCWRGSAGRYDCLVLRYLICAGIHSLVITLDCTQTSKGSVHITSTSCHFISQTTSFHLNQVAVRWFNQSECSRSHSRVKSDCEFRDALCGTAKTGHHTVSLFWLVAAMVNWVDSHSHSVRMKWG